MILAAIVAMDENNAIGIDGGLPWHLPEDLKFFKRTTMGCPVLMGRKTFASLNKLLPGRLNIVISRQKNLELPEGVLLYDSLEDGLKRLAEEEAEEGFVIGGGNIYEQSMKLVDRLYITVVHTQLDKADTYFPHVDHAHWKLSWKEEHEADDRHQYAYTFQKWDRIKEI